MSRPILQNKYEIFDFSTITYRQKANPIIWKRTRIHNYSCTIYKNVKYMLFSYSFQDRTLYFSNLEDDHFEGIVYICNGVEYLKNLIV